MPSRTATPPKESKVQTARRQRAQRAAIQRPGELAAATHTDADAPASRTYGPRPGGALQTAFEVLRDAGEPLTMKELAARTIARKPDGLKGKTPEASIAAAIYVSIKKGHGLFVRDGKKFAAAKDSPAS